MSAIVLVTRLMLVTTPQRASLEFLPRSPAHPKPNIRISENDARHFDLLFWTAAFLHRTPCGLIAPSR
jgi:hypothetical protein